jgi:predicted small metal-binding protein
MARKYIDCREHAGDTKCSVAISADTDDELLEAVIQHVKVVHGFEDTPEVRKELKNGFKEGTIPA